MDAKRTGSTDGRVYRKILDEFSARPRPGRSTWAGNDRLSNNAMRGSGLTRFIAVAGRTHGQPAAPISFERRAAVPENRIARMCHRGAFARRRPSPSSRLLPPASIATDQPSVEPPRPCGSRKRRDASPRALLRLAADRREQFLGWVTADGCDRQPVPPNVRHGTCSPSAV